MYMRLHIIRSGFLWAPTPRFLSSAAAAITCGRTCWEFSKIPRQDRQGAKAIWSRRDCSAGSSLLIRPWERTILQSTKPPKNSEITSTDVYRPLSLKADCPQLSFPFQRPDSHKSSIVAEDSDAVNSQDFSLTPAKPDQVRG